ncbi:MAG: nuclear transport factor 2 family protein [Rhizobiaceae bacterium]
MSNNRKEQIRALLKSIETGDPGPVSVVDEAQYVQHNPQTHEGSEGLAELFKRLSKTQPRVNMVRVFEDGDYVFAHMEYDFSSRKICFEVFRFEGGRAVEHWDNIQERQGPNASGHSMVDGATQVEDRELTQRNRETATNFVETILIDGQFHRLGQFISIDDFTEHNPFLNDDVSSLRVALAGQEQGSRNIEYQKLHRVLAEGNFVLCVSEGTRNGNPTAYYDLFRFRGGKIIEHWDTTEKIAPEAEWRNQNGKF